MNTKSRNPAPDYQAGVYLDGGPVSRTCERLSETHRGKNSNFSAELSRSFLTK